MTKPYSPVAYRISSDLGDMDLDVIHGYLTRSFWAAGISRDLVERSLQHSLGFGIFEGKEQVGFARVISDQATFAYVCDVFVLESHQGRGLALLLMEAVRAHPALQGLRRWLLFTKDAHGLYRKVGFTDTSTPERVMEIFTRHGMKP